jgi:hypothetical protein
MKIRIIQDFKTARGELKTGQVIDVKPSVADKWVSGGLAIYLKIIGVKETK